jgi:hypothetical protein
MFVVLGFYSALQYVCEAHGLMPTMDASERAQAQ